MSFLKTKENFICEHCSFHVTGNGYTNHCPECLWSKHVDIEPGDRKSTCGGAMEPKGGGIEHGEHFILHECTLCGHTKKNKIAHNDNMDAYVRIPGIV